MSEFRLEAGESVVFKVETRDGVYFVVKQEGTPEFVPHNVHGNVQGWGMAGDAFAEWLANRAPCEITVVDEVPQ